VEKHIITNSVEESIRSFKLRKKKHIITNSVEERLFKNFIFEAGSFEYFPSTKSENIKARPYFRSWKLRILSKHEK
jgi:hypothetical protein